MEVGCPRTRSEPPYFAGALVYFTVKLSCSDWLLEPAVAVTVRLYCPAGVPFGFVWVLDPVPPPPHEQKKRRANTGRALIGPETPLLLCSPWKTTNPNTKIAQKRGTRLAGEAADIRAVVVTVTVSADGELALRLMLPGTTQLAPCGAPVQLIIAVPAIPPPPITRL